MRSEKELLEEMIMVIRDYGLENKKVFDAMRKIPRHWFIDSRVALDEAYGDYPVLIGGGQTISQPFTVAFMLDLLELKEGLNVLEIGTGSGWNAALIEKMGCKVTTIEYDPKLAEKARENLKKVNSRAEVIAGDGGRGYKPNSPYDRIIVTCAAPKILEPWKEQLTEDGIIVLPEGGDFQKMVKARKSDNFEEENHGYFRFVPLRD